MVSIGNTSLYISDRNKARGDAVLFCKCIFWMFFTRNSLTWWYVVPSISWIFLSNKKLPPLCILVKQDSPVQSTFDGFPQYRDRNIKTTLTPQKEGKPRKRIWFICLFWKGISSLKYFCSFLTCRYYLAFYGWLFFLPAFRPLKANFYKHVMQY